MLCLKNNTNPGWIESVKKNLLVTISDHAHCEKKAANTGMVLLNKYPDKTDLGYAMCELIEEEIGHYRSVLQILEQMGHQLSRDTGDPYAKELFTIVRKNEPERFLDHLLVAGIIEARSCERLQILAENVEDENLRKFYKDLADTEAGHYVTFTNIARKYFDKETVKARLDEMTDFEANIISNLTNEPTMHG